MSLPALRAARLLYELTQMAVARLPRAGLPEWRSHQRRRRLLALMFQLHVRL